MTKYDIFLFKEITSNKKMQTIDYKGVRLFVPPRYYHKNLTDRFVSDSYEKEEVALCNKFDYEDNVLEIGTCLGFVTAILSKRVKSIISVEANPELKSSLIEMKEYNKLHNLTLINSYISKNKKQVEFQTYDNIVAGSGDREDQFNNVRGWGHTLKTYFIDSIDIEDVESIGNVNSLCLDMEGGELNFLTDYKDFISKNIKKICIELHGHQMKMDDTMFNKKCVNIIESCGLKLKVRDGCVYYFEK